MAWADRTPNGGCVCYYLKRPDRGKQDAVVRLTPITGAPPIAVGHLVF